MIPTNFRVTDGLKSCSSCRYYDPANDWCWRFDHPVRPHQLSDGHEPKNPGGPAQALGPQQGMAPVQPPEETQPSVVDQPQGPPDLESL